MDDGSAPVDRRIGALSVASGESPNPAGGVVGRDEESDAHPWAPGRGPGGTIGGTRLVEGAPGIGKTTPAGRSALAGHRVHLSLCHGRCVGVGAGPRRSARVAEPGKGPVGRGRRGAGRRARIGVGAGPSTRCRRTGSSSPPRPCPCWQPLPPVVPCSWSWTTCTGSIASRPPRSSSPRADFGPDAVAFVFATRASPDSAWLTPELPSLRVTGLPRSAASHLVPPGVTASVVDRLVEGTQGNPLALLEVSSRLSAAQRVRAAPPPEPLPVGERLQAGLRIAADRTVRRRLVGGAAPRHRT